ncbi:MAG: hypothetical protein ABWY05_18075 [Noviherbaspirillum sp.]
MSTLDIKDLSISNTLDRKAMSAIRGGDGAAGVYGLIAAFNPLIGRAQSAAVNFVQNNTIFMAEQMTNQIMEIGVTNSAAAANISVMPTVVGITQKQ